MILKKACPRCHGQLYLDYEAGWGAKCLLCSHSYPVQEREVPESEKRKIRFYTEGPALSNTQVTSPHGRASSFRLDNES